MLVSLVMESLLLLLVLALDVDGDVLAPPWQQLALAVMSAVATELDGPLNDDGRHRMSSPGNVESSELESLKLSHNNRGLRMTARKLYQCLMLKNVGL